MDEGKKNEEKKKKKHGDWKTKNWLLLKKKDKNKKIIYLKKEGKEVLAFKQAQEAWKNKLNTPLLLTNT
jgi:hypothetical protein